MERRALPSGGVMGDGVQGGLRQLRERCVHGRAWNTDATVQGYRSCSLPGPEERSDPLSFTQAQRTTAYFVMK
ncbi:DNA mismatch repair protein MutS [Dissostichus eleginoides]|uniref:DNA mismatch repair protein MutS n=1 Tax=Dissostichus eleginoides TaxID=100907 RepID=A0AAD9B6R6_DISEL|nr:DNA mismatch repair protein MutS [Dissostichus eleginoides]